MPAWFLEAVLVFLLVFILGLLIPVVLSGLFPPGPLGTAPHAPSAPSRDDAAPPVLPLDPLSPAGGQPYIAWDPALVGPAVEARPAV